MNLRKCFLTVAMGAGLSLSTSALDPVIYAQVGTGAAPDAARTVVERRGNPGSGAVTSPSTMGGSAGSSNGTAVDSGANANANMASPAGPPADPTTVGNGSAMHNGMPSGSDAEWRSAWRRVEHEPVAASVWKTAR